MKLAAILIALALCVVAADAAQSTRTQAKPAVPDETSSLAAGWAALASGDAAKASAAAEALLTRNPRSTAAATLLIDAGIACGGAIGGLTAYEHWLAGRTLEDGYLIRRAARALLWEETKRPEVAVDALQYLSADDDASARAELARRMVEGGFAETRALARIGDEGAVRRLVGLMKIQPGSKQAIIEALIQSRSPLAIPALTDVLDDPNHDNDVATAADGLGLLKGTTAIPKLRRLYGSQPPGVYSPVALMSAGALFRMDDVTGLELLQRQLTSDVPALRLNAAKMMADHPDNTWLQVVHGLLGASEPVVRLEAAKLLAPYDLEQARQAIAGAMSDPNPEVQRLAAAVTIERTATDFATLRRLVRSSDDHVRVKAAARVLELSR